MGAHDDKDILTGLQRSPPSLLRAAGNRFYRDQVPVSMIDEPATCRPPAPLHPAAKRDECLVGITHDFHRSGLTGREKPTTTSNSTFPVRSHCICARCALSRPINCSTRNGLSMPLGPIGETLVWERSLRKLISSPPGNAGRRSVLNR